MNAATLNGSSSLSSWQILSRMTGMMMPVSVDQISLKYILRGCHLAMLCLIALSAHSAHAHCSSSNIPVQVSTEISQIEIKTDYTISDIAQMAGSLAQKPPHPLLGFYRNSAGYRSKVSPINSKTCNDVSIKVQLIATTRIIEIARDIVGNPCLFKAALNHYKFHADVQTHAFIRTSQDLQQALQDFAMGKSRSFRLQASFNDDVSHFVDQWLGRYQEKITTIQTTADTPEQILALSRACEV